MPGRSTGCFLVRAIATESRVVYQASVPYKDPALRRSYQREYIRRTAEKHREHSRKAMQRWREAHPDARRAEGRAYYARDPARRQRQIDASPNRRGVRKASDARRRARKLGAAGSYSTAEWLLLLGDYDRRCGYCGDGGPMQADHRTPLSRGGDHRIENIIPACGRCNREKATMTEIEFRRRQTIIGAKRPKIHNRTAG